MRGTHSASAGLWADAAHRLEPALAPDQRARRGGENVAGIRGGRRLARVVPHSEQMTETEHAAAVAKLHGQRAAEAAVATVVRPTHRLRTGGLATSA